MCKSAWRMNGPASARRAGGLEPRLHSQRFVRPSRGHLQPATFRQSGRAASSTLRCATSLVGGHGADALGVGSPALKSANHNPQPSFPPARFLQASCGIWKLPSARSSGRPTVPVRCSTTPSKRRCVTKTACIRYGAKKVLQRWPQLSRSTNKPCACTIHAHRHGRTSPF